MKKKIFSFLMVAVMLFWNVPVSEGIILTYTPNEAIPVALPDNNSTGITRTFTVSGIPMTSTVNNVSLRYSFSPNHTWVGDLRATLTSPDTETHTLFYDIGDPASPANTGDSSNLAGPYVMSDTGGTTLWSEALLRDNNQVLLAGTYRTTSINANVATSMNATFGYPGPPLMDQLFNDKKEKSLTESGNDAVNGTWTFVISDNAAGDTGTISLLELVIDVDVPLAANASVGGRLVTGSGRAVANAEVMITDTNTGERRSVRSSPFGYFKIEELPVGNLYVMQITSKQYQFPVQTFTLNEDISDLEIVANGEN
jgi:subtilisin-like proprotein convertase family protein